jgi:hypothetical protein
VNTNENVRVYVLRGGGLLLVGPDGRQETVYEPQIADGASPAQVKEVLEMHADSFQRAIERITAPVIDLTRDSTTNVGSGG